MSSAADRKKRSSLLFKTDNRASSPPNIRHEEPPSPTSNHHPRTLSPPPPPSRLSHSLSDHFSITKLTSKKHRRTLSPEHVELINHPGLRVEDIGSPTPASIGMQAARAARLRLATRAACI